MNVASEQLLAYMIQHASDVISLHDANGICLCISPSVENVLGYQPDSFLQRPISTIIHPDDVEAVQQFVQSVIHNVKNASTEFRIQKKSGDYIWIETTAKRSPHPTVEGEIALVATTRDVTDRKMAKQQLLATQLSNQRLIDLLPDMVVIYRRGDIVYMNPAGLRMLGATSMDDVTHINLVQNVVTNTQPIIRSQLRAFIESGTIGPVEQQLTTMTGRLIDVEASATRIEHEGTSATLWLVRDITSRKEVERTLEGMNRQLHTLSTRDPLTDVGNRRVFDEMVQQSMALHQTRDTTVALLILDIDCFKLYNDTYGHQQGDACLKSVSDAIVRATHRKAVVTRYGGEEFAIILPDKTLSDAINIAQRIQTEISNLKLEHHSSTVTSYVTVSIGIGYLKGGENGSIDALIRRSDAALYHAKETGRNKSVVWDPIKEF